MYEGTVYPGTLTYSGTVPNIENTQLGVVTAIRMGPWEIPGYGSYTSFGDDLSLGREPQKAANVYEKPGNKCRTPAASGERLQLAGNDDSGGAHPHFDGGFSYHPGAVDASPARDQCIQHDAGSSAAGARQRGIATDLILGDFC